MEQESTGGAVDQRGDTRTLIILAFSATAGVLVEFYDFFIYGYAAASAFPPIFFPKSPQPKPSFSRTWPSEPDSQRGFWAHSSLATLAIVLGGSIRS